MASKYNFTIDQGTTSTFTFTWGSSTNSAYNLTGYNARCYMKTDYSVDTPTLSFTSSDSSITITGSDGQVTLNFDASSTSGIKGGSYIYDIELISPSNVITRILEGKVTFTPEVTR